MNYRILFFVKNKQNADTLYVLFWKYFRIFDFTLYVSTNESWANVKITNLVWKCTNLCFVSIFWSVHFHTQVTLHECMCIMCILFFTTRTFTDDFKFTLHALCFHNDISSNSRCGICQFLSVSGRQKIVGFAQIPVFCIFRN